MRYVDAGVLRVAFEDYGPATGDVAILLHGFPYDIRSYGEVAPRLAAAGMRVIVPYLRGFGETRFLSQATMRSGQQGALGADLLALMDALGIGRAILAGYDWGGRAASVVAALWPERVQGLVSGGLAYNIQDIAQAGRPADPEQEARYWYQYYFHGARGAAGLAQNRYALCRHLWRLWSPEWRFDEATYAASAAAFEVPDFVPVVLHSYRHRFGLVAGDPAYDLIERQLAAQPAIAVPTEILLGGSDGVEGPVRREERAEKFTAACRTQVIDGAGHNMPQERPEVFAQAVLALRQP